MEFYGLFMGTYFSLKVAKMRYYLKIVLAHTFLWTFLWTFLVPRSAPPCPMENCFLWSFYGDF
jgi:hypothetical protein